MQMDQFTEHQRRPSHRSTNETYGDEIMDSNWNPSVTELVDATVPCAIAPPVKGGFTAVESKSSVLGHAWVLAKRILGFYRSENDLNRKTSLTGERSG